MAKPDTILISSVTHRLVSDLLDAQPLGPQTIRGLPRQLELFSLATVRQRSAAGPLARRDRLCPLVGRDEVLRDIDEQMAQLRASGLRVCAFRADAGIGKSRVLRALLSRARHKGIEACHVVAHAWTGQQPYDLVSSLIAELMTLPAQGDVERRRGAARASMARWPEDAQGPREVVNDLLGIDPPGKAWQQLTPSQRQREISAAVQWLLIRRAADNRLLLVFDDLHLADRDSLRLLESVTRRVQALPLLVCVGYRPEMVHRWHGLPWFREIDLAPLPADKMHELALELLGDDASLQNLTERVLARADGNALFLEQIVVSLVDDGSLLGTQGAYRCVREANQVPVPETIAALISARVDRLPPGAKSLIEAAAVVAEPIDVETAATMLGSSPQEALGALNLSCAAGLTTGIEEDGATLWRFTHGLMQEVVLRSLTVRRRRVLHRAACDALLAKTGGSGERAAVLATHAWHGQAWDLAADQALKAIRISIARSANRDSLRMFELGTDAIGHLSQSDARHSVELALRLAVIGAQLPMGRIDELVENLERAEQLAGEIGDFRQRSNAVLQLAVVHWVRGAYADGLAAANRIGDEAALAGHRNIDMAATQVRMMLEHGRGNYREVLRLAGVLNEHYGDELGTRQFIPGWAIMASINAQCFMADALWRMGDSDAARRACEAAYRDLSERDHAFSRSMIDFTYAEALLASDQAASAADVLKGTVALCHAHDLTSMLPAIVATLCGAKALAGDAQEALAQLDAAQRNRIDMAGGRYNAYYFPKNRAIALACLRRFEEAAQAAAQAAAAAASFGQCGHEADGMALLADIELAAGHREQAVIDRRRALTLAARCAMQLQQRRFPGPELQSPPMPPAARVGAPTRLSDASQAS